MAVSSKAAVMRRRGLLALSLLAVVLTVGAGVLLWQAVDLSSVSRASAQVEQLKPAASGIRLALIGLVASLWPRLVHLACRDGRVDESRRDDLLMQRWRVAGWLSVIELVLGQNLFGRFLVVMTGPAV